MPSLLKSESSRANGAKSSGPKTDAGRQRSSQNAIKHGFTAQTIVLPNEDAAEYDQFLSTYLQHFQPDGPVELDLVHAMAAAKWRLRRLALIEQQLFIESFDYLERAYADRFTGEERLAKAFERLAGSTSFPFLYRVQSRLEREYSRALRNLLQLQNPRPPRRSPEDPLPGPPSEAGEICKNEPTTPQDAEIVQPSNTPRVESALRLNSRSLYRSSFPAAVFGNSGRNSMRRGYL